MIQNINELLAQKGERILPKWTSLVEFTEESGIRFGYGIKVQFIPGAGIEVTADPDATPWIHPWKIGTPDDENRIQMRPGLVNGEIPFVTEEARLGETDKDTGAPAMIQLEPKQEGQSYIAVGINVRNNSEERAELSSETSIDELRVSEIDELPSGFKSGGVVPTDDGWAWYPLVTLFWNENLVERIFQIVHHNLQNTVVAGGEAENQERHFFFPSG